MLERLFFYLEVESNKLGSWSPFYLFLLFCSVLDSVEELLRGKKRETISLGLATTPSQHLLPGSAWDGDEWLMLTIWKIGVTNWHVLMNKKEKEPANYLYLLSLKPKGNDRLAGSQTQWLHIGSHSLAWIVSDLKRPWFWENLKFKTVWWLKAPLNVHCGSEQYIITSVVLRWCTEPIYQKSTIPLVMYDYKPPQERRQW